MDRVIAYPLKQIAKQVIDMPRGSKVLTIQDSQGIPTLYALTEDGQEVIEPHTFHSVRTGMPFWAEKSWRYIGTYQVYGFQMSWNVFEEHPLYMATIPGDAYCRGQEVEIGKNLGAAIETITELPRSEPVIVDHLPKGGEWGPGDKKEPQQTSIISPRGNGNQ